MPPATIRPFGAVNGRGLWTLYRRELIRFLRYSWEGLGGPAVSSLWFLAVFVLAFGSAEESADFARFVAPGIAIFALVSNPIAPSPIGSATELACFCSRGVC